VNLDEACHRLRRLRKGLELRGDDYYLPALVVVLRELGQDRRHSLLDTVRLDEAGTEEKAGA